MSASPAQIAANRENALRSTGPRTEEGKAAVRLNAITHGIYATDLVASASSAGESQEDFNAFLADLSDAYQPWGPLEIIQVKRIASLHWRLQRVLRAESGEIAQALDTLPDDLHRKRRTDADYAYECLMAAASLDEFDRRLAVAQTREVLTASAYGLTLLRNVFISARDHLAANDSLTPALVRSLHLVSPSAHLTGLLPPFPTPEKGGDPTSCPVPSLQPLLAALEDAIDRLAGDIERYRQREEARDDALRRTLALPAAPTADRLLRYEKALSGQLTRAIDELHRLQRHRLTPDEISPNKANPLPAIE